MLFSPSKISFMFSFLEGTPTCGYLYLNCMKSDPFSFFLLLFYTDHNKKFLVLSLDFTVFFFPTSKLLFLIRIYNNNKVFTLYNFYLFWEFGVEYSITASLFNFILFLYFPYFEINKSFI